MKNKLLLSFCALLFIALFTGFLYRAIRAQAPDTPNVELTLEESQRIQSAAAMQQQAESNARLLFTQLCGKYGKPVQGYMIKPSESKPGIWELSPIPAQEPQKPPQK